MRRSGTGIAAGGLAIYWAFKAATAVNAHDIEGAIRYLITGLIVVGAWLLVRGFFEMLWKKK